MVFHDDKNRLYKKDRNTKLVVGTHSGMLTSEAVATVRKVTAAIQTGAVLMHKLSISCL